ncbi:Uncharacterized protein DBV15_02710 [Temnothorax longispinosus]|uniref:Uncharacterized protein n=1 Tax=Temnothorax longispinosus TaxID=300112 RepID=A0A4S2KDW3_9HYME|nr:Uncharacterized protein DBV15_02710 [Temnothorax longispinosus]
MRSAYPRGFPMPPAAIFSLTSADLPLTEITFAQSNPTSCRDDAVAPRGSRQLALQKRPTTHSMRNEINPTNSTSPVRGWAEVYEKVSKGETMPLSITPNTPIAYKMCYRFIQI